jgi:hypothetical protein
MPVSRDASKTGIGKVSRLGWRYVIKLTETQEVIVVDAFEVFVAPPGLVMLADV